MFFIAYLMSSSICGMSRLLSAEVRDERSEASVMVSGSRRFKDVDEFEVECSEE